MKEILLATSPIFLYMAWKIGKRRKIPYYEDPFLDKVCRKLLNGRSDKVIEIGLEELAEALWGQRQIVPPDQKVPLNIAPQAKKQTEKIQKFEIDQRENPEERVPSEKPEASQIEESTKDAEKKGEQERTVETPSEENSPIDRTTSEMEKYLLDGPQPLSSFLRETILPLKEKLLKEGAYEAVLKVLFLLADTEDKSSVASAASRDTSIGYSILKNVSLLEHSINTALIGIELVKKEMPFVFDLLPGKYFLIFLGHDVGKSYLKEDYATGDHPILSARILAEIIPESYPHKHDILATVEKHHHENIKYPPLSVKEYDLYLLQTADRLAREKEISQTDVKKVLESSSLNQQGTAEDFEGITPVGMEPGEILAKIAPLINRSLSEEELNNPDLPIPPDAPEGSFLAVSQPDGTVYVRPDAIYEAFLRVVKEKGLERENASIIAGGKNNTLKQLVAWFMEKDILVPGHVKVGYFGRWYSFKIGNSEYRAIFTPIKATAFGYMPGDLEKIRKGNPRTAKIHSFRRTSGGKGNN